MAVTIPVSELMQISINAQEGDSYWWHRYKINLTHPLITDADTADILQNSMGSIGYGDGVEGFTTMSQNQRKKIAKQLARALKHFTGLDYNHIVRGLAAPDNKLILILIGGDNRPDEWALVDMRNWKHPNLLYSCTFEEDHAPPAGLIAEDIGIEYKREFERKAYVKESRRKSKKQHRKDQYRQEQSRRSAGNVGNTQTHHNRNQKGNKKATPIPPKPGLFVLDFADMDTVIEEGEPVNAV